MHYLNTRRQGKEIILFLNDRNKFTILKNEIESIFEKFQGDDGLTGLKKLSFETQKKLKSTVLDSLDHMENHYLSNINLEGHFGADRDSLIENHYKNIMNQTLKDIYNRINEVSNEEFCKIKPNDIEMKYFIDENKMSSEEKAMVGRKLTFLLKNYELSFKKSMRKDNLKSVEGQLNSNTKNFDTKDYIKENMER